MNQIEFWNDCDDLTLTEIVLRNLRRGLGYEVAFSEAAGTLNKDEEVCRERWDHHLADKYHEAVKMSYSENRMNTEPTLSIEMYQSDDKTLNSDELLDKDENLEYFLYRAKSKNEILPDLETFISAFKHYHDIIQSAETSYYEIEQQNLKIRNLESELILAKERLKEQSNEIQRLIEVEKEYYDFLRIINKSSLVRTS